MTSSPKPAARSARLASETTLRTARLASGLVMMVFVTMHLGNLSLSLISLEAAEAGRLWFLAIWRNPVGTVVLYAALLTHVALVLRSLYRRRSFVMPLREAVQVVAGLAIPLLVALHVAGTRIFHELTGVPDTYEFVVRTLWITSPGVGLIQAIALVVVWAHGCLGLHFWLRYRSWYPAAAPWFLITAVLVPVVSLLAFAHAGQLVALMDRQPLPESVDQSLIPGAIETVYALTDAIYVFFAALVAGLFALRTLRRRRERRNLVEIRYESGQSVRVPRGHSVLEASRIGGVPHYSVCGGKGRCSTCRVRVTEGLSDQPPAGQVEEMTLARIHAGPDIRLACQFRPVHDLTVMPLLAAGQERALPIGSRQATPGREQEIAVLFCDIRSFTALADHRLPYDVVFLLNRYFAVVGKAVEKSGGQLDKFIGDGAMALFGLGTTKQEACRQALMASAAIIADLALLSEELAGDIPAPLRVAIGIHAGPAIVGAMGYGGVMGVTAIGDTVNVASRLESAAKEFDAAIVISDDAAGLSGIDMSAFEIREIAIRGSATPLNIRLVPQGAAFAAGVSEPVA
jgi:adenylate cyclase